MGSNFWFILEVIIIGLVILYQLYRSYKVYLDIDQLKHIFKNPLELVGDKEQSDDKYSKKKPPRVKTKGDNESIKQIKDNVNSYLINNYGADVNFSIIKDIIDREVQVKDEEINNSITTPLYLGLAATMVGIIFGLFAMPKLEGDSFSEGINALINGVKFAMIGSLSGLALTTTLSSFFYKNAKKIVEIGKNNQFSYLQTNLLPVLIRGDATGVAGLKSSIDNLSRDLVNLVNVAEITSDSINKQDVMLNKIQNIGVTNMARINLELFEKMENSLSRFDHFAQYLNQMGTISQQLEEFAVRTSDIDKVVNSLDKSLGDNRAILEFFTNYMSEVESRGDRTLGILDDADRHFSEATRVFTNNARDSFGGLSNSLDNYHLKLNESVDALFDELLTRINRVNETSQVHEETLKKIYDDLGSNLNSLTERYTDRLDKTISKIGRKDNLNELDRINTVLNQILKELKTDKSFVKKMMSKIQNRKNKQN